MNTYNIISNVQTANGEDVENTYDITFDSIESATVWLEANGGGSIRVEDEDGDWDIIIVNADESDEANQIVMHVQNIGATSYTEDIPTLDVSDKGLTLAEFVEKYTMTIVARDGNEVTATAEWGNGKGVDTFRLELGTID